MKQGVHPEYKQQVATCVCGNTLVVGSTLATVSMDICSGCHPFYTGQQKIVDTEGRVDRFKKRYAAENMTAGELGKKKKAKLAAQAAHLEKQVKKDEIPVLKPKKMPKKDGEGASKDEKGKDQQGSEQPKAEGGTTEGAETPAAPAGPEVASAEVQADVAAESKPAEAAAEAKTES